MIDVGSYEKVRGPKEEWVNSNCLLCGGWYFGAALSYAQAMHDKDGKCPGFLTPISSAYQAKRRLGLELNGQDDISSSIAMSCCSIAVGSITFALLEKP